MTSKKIVYRAKIAKKYERKGLSDPFYNLVWHYGRPKGNEAMHYYINYYDKDGKAIVRLVYKRDLDHYDIQYWRAGNDDETEDYLLNCGAFLNEDGLEI